MLVKNMVEPLVWDTLKKVLDSKPEACRCEKCQADMAAYALNKLPPKYVVSRKGEILARAVSLDNKYYIAVLVAVTEAVEIVSRKPRHDD